MIQTRRGEMRAAVNERPRTWQLIRPLLPAIAAGLLTAAGTVLAGWPYWRGEVLLAVVNVVVAGAFVTAGLFLAGATRPRWTGVLLTVAGLCWLITWTMSWNVGVLPVVGIYGSTSFYIMFGSALLLYPDGRFTGRLDRIAVAAAALAFWPLMTLSILASEPEWNGYAPDVWWPSPLRSAALFSAISDAYLVINPLLALLFLFLVVRRVRGVRGPERSAAAPVLVVVGVAAVGAALFAPAIETDDLNRVVRGVALQGVAMSAFPLVLLVGTGRRALGAATAADRVLRLAGPATVRSVRDALRTVLRDPSVEVVFWLPDADRHVDGYDGGGYDDGGGYGYVDVEGRPADPVAAARGGRWSRTVHTRTGEPLAVVTGDPALGRHPTFADAALLAGRLALENAQLQVAVQARLVETRAVQARIAQAEAEQRRLMARDLQDGVRQRLLDLARTAQAAEAAAADPAASSSALHRLREGLLAANHQVRAVSRGLDREEPRPPEAR